MPLSRLKSPKLGHKDIQDILDALLAHILSVVQPIDVILIGSYLRGEADEFSDIDLVVIVNDGKNPSATHFALVRDRPFRERPLDLIVLNQSDFDKMCDVGGIAFEAKNHGKSLLKKGG